LTETNHTDDKLGTFIKFFLKVFEPSSVSNSDGYIFSVRISDRYIL
jgi:hypothetical protein